MFRVVTYNVHKCRGLDRRVRPERIVTVLRETGADIVALQEVLSIENGPREHNQARFIAEELGMEYRVGENRRLNGGAYGNAILSRFPIESLRNHDITWRGREKRGCLAATIEIDTHEEALLLSVFNVHLGTAFLERRHQARLLVSEEILNNKNNDGIRIVLGDFNEWTHGLASQLLAQHFESADIRHHLRSARTYPGLLPLLHLDHVYFDPTLELKKLSLHRSRIALIASDHLPLVSDFILRKIGS